MSSSARRNIILAGDVRSQLNGLPAGSVDCVITSPPYFLLRDYGVHNQVGLENDVDGWVTDLRLVMESIARVLKSSGSVWLNLGDSFSRHPKYGAPAKSLLLGPERLLLALLSDGWLVRNKVIWAKTNTRPSSVRDRLTCSWEAVYFLTRAPHYFFDLDNIRVPHTSKLPKRPAASGRRPPNPTRPEWVGPLAGSNIGLQQLKERGHVGHPLGKNPGDVWSLAASNFRGHHFATFPSSLVRRPLKAACPERTCTGCGQPWERTHPQRVGALATTGELRARCDCARPWQPGLVLDPFFGSGTVGMVAEEIGRDWLGIEINPEYVALAEQRIAAARANYAEHREAA